MIVVHYIFVATMPISVGHQIANRGPTIFTFRWTTITLWLWSNSQIPEANIYWYAFEIPLEVLEWLTNTIWCSHSISALVVCLMKSNEGPTVGRQHAMCQCWATIGLMMACRYRLTALRPNIGLHAGLRVAKKPLSLHTFLESSSVAIFHPMPYCPLGLSQDVENSTIHENFQVLCFWCRK